MARMMKDSGIEWIGEIPDTWAVTNIGRLFNVKAGGDAKPELYADAQDSEHPYPVYTNTLNPNQVYAYTSEPLFPSNSITVTGRGDIGHAFYRATEYDAIIRLLVLMPKVDIDCRYYAYWIENVITFFTNSAAVGQLSAQQILPYEVCYSSKNEQQRIADFLDRKCAEIDVVIEKTKATIEEYKELKQSVITEAVTKGVRDPRPMKDSGIEWIGEIPEEWLVLRGKNLFVETNERSTTGEEELLTVSHITGITPRSQKNVNMFMSESLVDYKICRVNDIAANTMWMWQGAIGVSKHHGVISPSYNVYRQTADAYDPDYLDFLLRIRPLVDAYNAHSTGITASRLRLYPEQFLSFFFIVPTRAEQQEIVVHLDRMCGEMDTLITKKTALLAELETYKKSLIYEYVTGKKEVN